MTFTLKSAQFRRERQALWTELDRLVAHAEKEGVKRLTASELSRLPVLYRAALSSLSVARAVSLDANVLEFLESLSARAYTVVYGVRRPLRDVLVEFFVESFPAALRALRGGILASAALTVLAAAVGFALVAHDPEHYYAIVPAGLADGRSPAADTEQLRAALYAGGAGGGEHAAFASFLFVHNTQISLLAFALGVFGGLPTLLLLLHNGLILGAFVEIHHARGLGVDVWGWLLPHLVPELTAVVLCAGAGLSVAGAVLMPGERSRGDALMLQGRRAGPVVAGAALLLLAAGLIEGIFRQAVHNVGLRYGVGVLGILGLTAWFLAPWRRAERRRP